MFDIGTSTRIRRGSSLTLSILFMSGLILTVANRAPAQDSNGIDKIGALVQLSEV